MQEYVYILYLQYSIIALNFSCLLYAHIFRSCLQHWIALSFIKNISSKWDIKLAIYFQNILEILRVIYVRIIVRGRGWLLGVSGHSVCGGERVGVVKEAALDKGNLLSSLRCRPTCNFPGIEDGILARILLPARVTKLLLRE